MEESVAQLAASRESQVLMENNGFRAMFLGAAGLLGGGVAGALASVVVASIANPECGGDNCVRPFVIPLAIVGALVGAWAGGRHGWLKKPDDKPWEQK